jgi:hypothetical protein
MVHNDLDDLDGLHGWLHSWLPLRSFHLVAAILIGRQDSLNEDLGCLFSQLFWYGSCATLKV